MDPPRWKLKDREKHATPNLPWLKVLLRHTDMEDWPY
jgi:hypothetical protein